MITKKEQLKYNNAKLDKGGWTDRDIICMVENDGILEWYPLEQDYIRQRYNELVTV